MISRPTLSQPWLLLLLVLPALPFLLFSALFAAWVPVLAVGWLVLVLGVRLFVSGRVFGQTPVDLPLLLILLLLPVTLWASADKAVTLPRVYAYVANVALFVAMAAQRWGWILKWSAWGLMAFALALAGLMLLGTDFGSITLPFLPYNYYDQLPGGVRFFWNPGGFNANLTGGMLAMLLPACVVFVAKGGSVYLRLVAIIAAIALVLILLLTQSLGALVGAMVAIAIVSSLLNRRLAWLWWGAGVAVVLLLLAIDSSFLAAFNPAGTLDSPGSLGTRVELWIRALYMSRDFALTGVGLGMFDPMVKLLYPLALVSPDIVLNHAHNIFLVISAEMGVLGLVAHLALFIILGWVLWQRSQQPSRDQTTILALALLGSLLSFLIHGQVDVILYAPRAAIILWGLFGLMSAVGTAPDTMQTTDEFAAGAGLPGTAVVGASPDRDSGNG